MSISGMISANWQIRILSLVLAFLLWLFVGLETIDRIELPVTIEYLNTPNGLSAETVSGFKAKALIEGPRILLLRQEIRGLSTRLDLSGLDEGALLHADDKLDIPLISGVKLVRVQPLRVVRKR